MLTNIVAYVVLVAAAAAAILLTRRAWRASHPVAKWGGVAGAGLLSAVLLIVAFASGKGLWMLYGPRGRPVRDIKVERTAERVARGQHIANTMCVGCHSLNGQLPLSGGKNLSDEAGIPLGDLYTINLTPAGPLSSWTDGEIFRAIRDGADERGRRLPVMSAQRARNLSDADIEAVIAFIRSQPPVEHETPPPNPSFLTAILAGAGQLPLLPGMAPDTIVAPPHSDTLAYGEYTVRWMGCDECHGPNYTGGGGGVLPVGPSLRSVKNWTSAQFIQTIRSGTTPFGKQLDSLMMPWTIYSRMTDYELSAVHRYLTSLE